MRTDVILGRGRRWLMAILIAAAGSAAAADGLDGSFSTNWRWLSDAGGLGVDAQNLRTRLRLRTEASGARQWRLQLDADDRRALVTRHEEGIDGPLYEAYDNRLRLRQVGLSINVAQGRLTLGRHRPNLLVLSAGDTDGASWLAKRGAWRAGWAAGRRVAFWESDPGPGTGPVQWGGEVGWQPTTASNLAIGLFRDEALDGTGRLRTGVNARLDVASSLHLSGHAEAEPGEGRLLWRLTGSWRSATSGWRVRADVGGQRLALFPVSDRIDSSLYAGRTHGFGVSVAHRWGRTLDMGLRLRSRYGARSSRTEVAHLRWRMAAGRRLNLQLTDSWSRWRQLERLDLRVESRVGRRWHLSAGAGLTAFEWQQVRDPVWGFRIRPQIGVRRRIGQTWEATVQMEERIDEFQHLRTEARAGLTCRI